METHRSDRTSRNKPRRSRSKFSSVNSRLNPNFDLREFLKCKDEENNFKNVELNPRTMEFEKLVNMLHPAFILEYLQKILHFLSSKMAKISFQNIALYKEVLLVRLCQDKSNLNCGKFSEEARKVAQQIVEVLEANQNFYEWTCKYERGIICPDVLVYEKVYNPSKNLRVTINNESNVIGHPLRPIQISNANGDSNTRVVQTTPTNKAHMLNTLLKFIKDNTQLKLEYPKVHKSLATQLTSLISQGKMIDVDEGFGFKSLYAPLYEALNAYKKVYDFDIMFQKDSEETLQLMLKKIPKPTKVKFPSPRRNDHGDHNNTKANASESAQNLKTNKSSKHMTNLINVGAVEDSFISASLREVLDFMEDESRASLEYTKLTKEQCGYLSRILQYSRDARYHEQFAAACRALLKRIDAASKNPDWRIAVEVGKTDRVTRLQSIVMFKEPCYRDNVSKKPTAHVAPQSQAARSPATSPRGSNTPPKAKPISFHSAGAIDKDNEAETETIIDKPERTVDDVAKLVANNSRKSKLLAAMSVPLECDKGERMMRLMGWQGGALGARGDGITEPIIPALHLAPGAGLGHVKHVKATQTINEFRCQFLNGIISFLRAEESETTLEYDECLEKKKIRFVNRTIQSLKQGIGFSLTRSDERHLLERVFEEMRKQGTLVEGNVSSRDNKKISLKKAPLTARKAKVKKQKNNLGSNPKNSDLASLYNQNTPVVQNTDTNGCITETITENQIRTLRDRLNLDGNTQTPKSAQTLAYRIMSLTKIRDFLETTDETRRYVFECAQGQKVKNKIKSFISTVIMNVNRKVKQQFGSVLESVIYSDIRKVTPAGCCLAVIFEDQNFTLQKKVYQKKFTNSARELPPPKSTDLKNTIVYLNNKIISSNNGVINGGDDDDVILIEKKVEVIEISDSEDDDNMEIDFVTVSAVQTENFDKPEEESSTDVIIEDNLDDSLISIDFSQNLSTSRETLLLDTMEEDCTVKTDVVDDEFDTDMKELKQAILDCELLCGEEVLPMPISCVKQESTLPKDDYKNGIKTLEINNNSSLIAEKIPNMLANDNVQPNDVRVHTVDCDLNVKHTTNKCLDVVQTVKVIGVETTKINNEDLSNTPSCVLMTQEDKIKLILENETNATINKSRDNLYSRADHVDSVKESVSKEDILIRLQTNKVDANENREITQRNRDHTNQKLDSLQRSKDKSSFDAENDLFENHKDPSPTYTKRSRSSSLSSEKESVCKKCKSQIRSVSITCKEPNKVLNKDIIRKVQSVISESIDIIIDNVDFLPRLECHGVKDGGLIYSCHDDKTFAWLTNFVVSDLDLNIIETDYPRNTYLEIKIYSFEDVDKILKRLNLYNPELDTSLWRVVNKKEFEEYVIITVEIDRESFDIVNRNNYSFFAGIDRAKFNIVWS